MVFNYVSVYQTTPVPVKGTEIWTKDGKLLKESSSAALRLKVTANPCSFIAIQSASTANFFQKIRNLITHLSVSIDAHSSCSLNLSSLSKRTHLSFFQIIWLKLCGNLTLDFIKNKVKEVEKRNEALEAILTNIKKFAAEEGHDPFLMANKLKKNIPRILNRQGIIQLKKDQTEFYVGRKDNEMKLIIVGRMIGQLSGADIYKASNLLTGQNMDVIAQTASFSLRNEFQILKKIHASNAICGIQKLPFVHVTHNYTSYLSEKPFHDLTDGQFLESTSTSKIIKCESLFEALHTLHKLKIVHGDIKPTHCFAYPEELKIAHLGYARTFSQVGMQNPLGFFSKEFTSDDDIRRSKYIALLYSLHQAAKTSNALVLRRILKEGLINRYQIDHFAKKMLNENTFDFAAYLLTEEKENYYRKECIELCEKHDVYSLGVTLLCILTKNTSINERTIAGEIKTLQNQSEIPRDLITLLTEMLKSKSEERPTSELALLRYKEIVAKLKAC